MSLGNCTSFKMAKNKKKVSRIRTFHGPFTISKHKPISKVVDTIRKTANFHLFLQEQNIINQELIKPRSFSPCAVKKYIIISTAIHRTFRNHQELTLKGKYKGELYSLRDRNLEEDTQEGYNCKGPFTRAQA